MKRKLYISAGHSGNEVGTVSKIDGLTEETFTKEIANRCKILGLPLVPFIPLIDRIKWINQNMNPNDVIIELHCDILDNIPGTDCGIFFYGGNKFSQDLALQLIGKFQEAVGLDRSWIRPDTSANGGRLGIIRDTKPLAFLIEMCDLDDITARMEVLNKGAQAMMQIADFLNDTPLPSPIPTPPTETNAEAKLLLSQAVVLIQQASSKL